jgi:hypothetical protein
MNRVDALALVKSIGLNDAMVQAARDVIDDATGYGPALDRAFAAYIRANSLTTGVTDTVVAAADEYGFQVLLRAVSYDLVLPSLALQIDTSVDAPLINIKLSQAFKAIKQLRDDAWAECALYGYSDYTNVGGFRVNLDFNEKQRPIAYEYR